MNSGADGIILGIGPICLHQKIVNGGRKSLEQPYPRAYREGKKKLIRQHQLEIDVILTRKKSAGEVRSNKGS